MTRIDPASVAETDSDRPFADAAREDGAWTNNRSLKPSDVADLRRLEDYIRRDETSLSRQRAILADCEGPARVIAGATVAAYEQALETLYRRRARLLARS